jgi:hypothetical protein
MFPKFYLLFTFFVSIIKVGFEFQIQILRKQVLKFCSKLFHISIQDYDVNK